MLNDSLELAAAAIAAAEAGPRQESATVRLAREATKGLTASAYISAPAQESAAALAVEQVLRHRGWTTARELKTLACVDNPAGPITDALACESFVFAILGRASEKSATQAAELAAAKRLGKPIIPLITTDWAALPKTAQTLAGYAGVSLVDKSAAAQNAALDALAGAIEREILASP